MTAQPHPSRLSVDEWVCAERVRVLYEGIKVAAVSGPVGLPVVAVLFWDVVDQQRIITWAVISGIVICPLSLLLLAYFRRCNQLPGCADYWLRLVRWRYFIVCASFGLAGVALFSTQSITHQMILFCFLVALTSTQTFESAQDSRIYLISLPALLIPFIVRAAVEASDSSRLLALLATAALAYILPTARNSSRMIDASLKTRFDNLDLIAQLKEQKELMEAARDDAVRARETAEGFAAQAVQANQAKSHFLAAASHDLRQPVHALGLFAAAARAHVQGDEGHAIMDKIAASIDSTEALFNALLDVSRLDAGIMLPDVQPFTVDSLLQRLAEEYAPRAAAKGLSLRWRPSGKTVSSDPALLERVLRNYLSNAIRYTANGPNHHGAVLLACRTRGSTLRIEVWDTGLGVAADKLGDIFQEFYQIGNPERNKANGLGLGLAIVKRIAMLLNHPIDVKSRLHQGSVFSITVPLAQASSIRVGRPNAPEVADESLLIGAVVLVIDDEVVVLQAIEMLLRQWGCLVVAAPSQHDALQSLARLDCMPDAILCDYRLQGNETGISVIHQLRQTLGPVSAALITGDTAPDRLLEASQSGLPLLHKPLNALQLKTSLCGLLASRHRADMADALEDQH
jgi:two-component system, sensor histidine kinase